MGKMSKEQMEVIIEELNKKCLALNEELKGLNRSSIEYLKTRQKLGRYKMAMRQFKLDLLFNEEAV